MNYSFFLDFIDTQMTRLVEQFSNRNIFSALQSEWLEWRRTYKWRKKIEKKKNIENHQVQLNTLPITPLLFINYKKKNAYNICNRLKSLLIFFHSVHLNVLNCLAFVLYERFAFWLAIFNILWWKNYYWNESLTNCSIWLNRDGFFLLKRFFIR